MHAGMLTRRVKQRLGKPATWAVAYLAMVPAFATVDAALPAGSFHDSNIATEQPLAHDEYSLEQNLTDAIRPGAANAQWTARGDKMLLSEITAQSVRRTTDGRVLLQLFGVYFGHPTVRARTNAIVVGGFHDWLQVNVEGEQVAYRIDGQGPQFVSYDVTLTNPQGGVTTPQGWDPPISILLPVPGDFLLSNEGTLTLPVRTSEQLMRFVRATEGDPSYASGLWLRMLYLSATTITTLGLGDITPVSTTARILIGLEAVLGLVTIGLFLNALAHRMRK
jgi:hypothetical protein